jgi:hypothetical protein
MTTVTAFSPTPLGPFQFQATLDGVEHNVIVTWNTYAQRWYCNIYDQSGVLIVAIARVGSPPNYDISIVAGYFTSTMVFRQATNKFEVSP